MQSTAGIIFIVLIGTELATCGVINSDRDPRGYGLNSIDTKAKRPFCNAFTGCGKKRSEEIAPIIPEPQNSLQGVEGISELLELNAEPAIDNLMKQIMSEAKMYEAIQEANRELFLQKMKNYNNGNRLPMQSVYSVQ